MNKKNVNDKKEIKEVIIPAVGQIDMDGAEVTAAEVDKIKKSTTKKKKATISKSKKTEKVEVKTNLDLMAIVGTKRINKKPLSFNQDESVAKKLTELADGANIKNSEALNNILKAIVNVTEKKCTVEIEEVKENKIQNTYKLDEDILDVLKSEAKSKGMSTNDYLNKVLKIVMNLK